MVMHMVQQCTHMLIILKVTVCESERSSWTQAIGTCVLGKICDWINATSNQSQKLQNENAISQTNCLIVFLNQ